MSDDLDGLPAEIGRWRDDADAASSALARRRRHWLRRQNAETTTLAGVLLTLAERQSPVTIQTVAGQQCGIITSVTRVLCTVAGAAGRALIPLAAIVAIEGGAGDIHDDRTPVSTTDLATVLAAVVGDRPPVVVYLSDGTAVSGTLAMVGADVLGVRQTPGGVLAHVPLGAIGACLLR